MLRSITKYSTCFELLPCHDLIMKSSYKRFSKFRKSVTCRAALHLEKCCSLRIYCNLIWKTIGRETETNCGLMSLFSWECAKVFAACLCASHSFVLTPGPTDQTITGACSSLHAAQRDSAYKSKLAIEPLNGRWGKRYAGLKFSPIYVGQITGCLCFCLHRPLEGHETLLKCIWNSSPLACIACA